MSRRLTTVAFFAAVVLVVSSAFAQTTPSKKKKKKKHPKPAATATVEIDANSGAAPPAATPAPPPPPSAPTTPATTASVSAGESPSESTAPSERAKPEPSAPTGVMPWSAGLLLGYGFDGAEHFGLGVRGGYTLPMHVYLGATFVYHFGSSSSGVSTSLLYPGLEGGYEIGAGPVVVRPYAGFGPVFVRASAPTTVVAGVTEGGGTSVTTLFGAWLGGVAMVPIADRFFAGGDLRLVLVSGFTTVGVFLTGGARF